MLKLKPSIRLGKKGDLSDFERGMVVGARQTGLSISKTTDLLGFSENGPKKRKYPVEAAMWTKMPCSSFFFLLISKVRGG